MVTSDDFDFDCITPLIRSTHDDTLDDAVNWGHVLRAVTEPTPPPRPVPSSIQQTPLSQNTSGLVNSSDFVRVWTLSLRQSSSLSMLVYRIPQNALRRRAIPRHSLAGRFPQVFRRRQSIVQGWLEWVADKCPRERRAGLIPRLASKARGIGRRPPLKSVSSEKLPTAKRVLPLHMGAKPSVHHSIEISCDGPSTRAWMPWCNSWRPLGLTAVVINDCQQVRDSWPTQRLTDGSCSKVAGGCGIVHVAKATAERAQTIETETLSRYPHRRADG